MAVNLEILKTMAPPQAKDFHITKVGNNGRARSAGEWHGAKSLEEAIANPMPAQNTLSVR